MKSILTYFKDQKENQSKSRSAKSEVVEVKIPERVQLAIENYKKNKK